MKRLISALLATALILIIIVTLVGAATGSALQPAAIGAYDDEALAVIGEEHGGIASYQSTDPDCRFQTDYRLYICPEPLPAVLPTQDPAAHSRALAMLGGPGLLLVPDVTNRRVMAFSPLTGDLVDANFIPPDPDHLNQPINAILSAGGDTVLVSSYDDDLVQEYDLMGNYLGFFAPAAGADPTVLDTPRGISLRANGNLLVASSLNPELDLVAEFDLNGNYLGPFIADGAGGLDSPYDIYQRTSDWLVSGAGSDTLHRYDLTGAYLDDLAAVDNFPQQINSADGGNILLANFSGSQKGVLELTAGGAVVHNFNPLDNGQRGIYELPDGNFLTTSGTGAGGAVYTMNGDTGAVIDTKISAVTARYIEFIQLDQPLAAIALEKTVGVDPSKCAGMDEIVVVSGTEVTYCYAATNVGTVTFTTHELIDDQLGVILNNLSFTLAPGASVFVTESATLTETTVNLALWTASNGQTDASDEDTALVTVIEDVPTATPTATLSPTATPPATASQTATAVSTPTSTATPSPTAFHTATSTSIPTATATPSPSASQTATATATATTTATPSPTVAVTLTASPTATSTPGSDATVTNYLPLMINKRAAATAP